MDSAPVEVITSAAVDELEDAGGPMMGGGFASKTTAPGESTAATMVCGMIA